jgi:hypothetical protein
LLFCIFDTLSRLNLLIAKSEEEYGKSGFMGNGAGKAVEPSYMAYTAFRNIKGKNISL